MDAHFGPWDNPLEVIFIVHWTLLPPPSHQAHICRWSTAAHVGSFSQFVFVCVFVKCDVMTLFAYVYLYIFVFVLVFVFVWSADVSSGREIVRMIFRQHPGFIDVLSERHFVRPYFWDVLSGRYFIREFLSNIFSKWPALDVVSGRHIVRICGTIKWS